MIRLLFLFSIIISAFNKAHASFRHSDVDDGATLPFWMLVLFGIYVGFKLLREHLESRKIKKHLKKIIEESEQRKPKL